MTDTKILDTNGKPLDLEAEFYCPNCEAFMDSRFSLDDIVCDNCDYIIATYRTREVLP